MSLRRHKTKAQNVGNSAEVNGERDPGVRPAQVAANLVDYAVIISLVLGGCCS